MKRSLIIANAALFLGLLFALWGLDPGLAARLQQGGAPLLVNYQGTLTDGSGAPLAGPVSLTFAIYDAQSGGAKLWEETHAGVSLNEGHFSVSLGGGVPLTAALFDGSERWIEVAVNGGPPLPRQRLTSVPYAILAEEAKHAATAPWSGLTGVPAGFADGVDDSAAYTAGEGLALSGNQFRVATLPKAGYIKRTLDSAGATGQYPAIIIGLDGLPLIAYYDASNGDLKVYHCDDMTCSGGVKTTLDSGGIVGEYASITIGQDGYGLISYYDRTNGDLKLAHCQNTPCTSADTTTVDSAGDVGQWTSITTNKNGYAFISYYDAGNGDLKAISCTNLTCTGKSVWTVDSGGDVGKHSSVARNSRGYGYISYYDATNGDLKVARCFNMNCNNPTIKTVDGTDLVGSEEENVGLWTSITVLMDGYPLIAYAKAFQTSSTSQALVAHCTNSSCSAATTDTIISMGSLGPQFQGFSATVGPNGQALFTFAWNTATRVYMGFCRDLTCTDTSLNDSAVISGKPRHTSLTIGADGLPIFAYYDDNGGDLKVVHCSDQSCQPYLRRR